MFVLCQRCSVPRFLPLKQIQRFKVTGSFNFDSVSRHYNERYASKPPEFNGSVDSTNSSGRRFTMVLPPPNVTGVLHLGHALTVAIEDSIIRYHRLRGDEVKWYPGYDHAGIATQQVVEKRLFREKRKRLDEISTSEFLAYCNEWKDQRIRDISGQLRILNASLDWHQLFYTMDERFVRAVRTAFIELHRQKKIFEMNEQWYMDCTEANKAILAGLNAGMFHIDPECTKAQLLEWINKNEPWCLSRQQLWGHKIPLYRKDDDKTRWIAAEDKEEAAKLLKTSVDMVVQSSDVLDTWFSSALIPLVVGGDWPRNRNPKFPVLDLMQTGHDIIGFWIARILTGEFPFTRVSLHGMIRDSQHRKMSKSLGNVIDPLHLINGVSLKEMIAVLKNSNLPDEEIETSVKATKATYPQGIRRYGSDALRFAFFKRDLLSLDVSMNLIESVSEGYKFCNKLWNAVKYVDIAVQKKNEVCGPEHKSTGEISDCVQLFDKHMADARPHLAFSAVFDFILLEFCDVYLETTKEAVWKADAQRLPIVSEILTSTASTALKCMSVFLPMVCNYLLDETTVLTNLQRIDFENFDHNDKLKFTEGKEESQTEVEKAIG
ncbi:Valyl-tRNA synthetase [Aphelenchoides besseyi]|nr:Valyl-tRNA synthetase [Aphelenchoides besseyi]